MFFYRVGAGSARLNTSTYVLWAHSGRQTLPLRLIAAIPCPRRGEAFQPWDSVPTIPCPRRGEAFQPWDSVPTPWGSFRSLRFCAHTVGKLSQPAIPCSRCGEAFAACNSVPTLWGSFRCPRCGEAFAACDSVPTPWGSFRSYLLWSLEEAQRCVTAGERSEPAVIQTLNSGLRRSPITLSKRYSTSSKPIS